MSATSPEMNKTGLADRINGSVSMHANPCLLLAEHIATAAREVADLTFPSWSYGNNTQQLIFDTHEQRPLPFQASAATLTSECADPDGRITELDLMTPIKTEAVFGSRTLLKRKPIIRGYKVQRDESRPMLITARARKIGLPILMISSGGDNGNCAFVRQGSLSLCDVGEVTLSEEDLQNPVRKAQLTIAYQALRNATMRYSRSAAVREKAKEFTASAADLVTIGATEKTRDAFGELDKNEEYIIRELQETTRDRSSFTTRIEDTILDEGVEYPIDILLKIERVDNSVIRATTTFKLPGAPNVTEAQLMPTLHVHPYLSKPLIFENVSLDQYGQLRIDFVELLKKRPERTPSTRPSCGC